MHDWLYDIQPREIYAIGILIAVLVTVILYIWDGTR